MGIKVFSMLKHLLIYLNLYKVKENLKRPKEDIANHSIFTLNFMEISILII
jgi:hypothetical protein